MTQIDLGPRSPGHCPVCGAVVPKVEDPDYRVRAWARHLNYLKHLREAHAAFYAWNQRWDKVKILPAVPALILLMIAGWQRDAWLLLLAGLLFLGSLVLLVAYRSMKIHGFRDSWRSEQGLPGAN